ncbi:MAG: MerR family transcriptional regulator [Cyanobacteria bacterium RYN_339]|nr:MerR family transcriptional regulator [Cyanobacteria bacterium RYN_339]
MAEYLIDDLARAAGTTVRNIRAYQDRGLLLAPRRRGRAAVYDDQHLARLGLIGGMLERGYSLASIYELTKAWDEGHSLGAVLGAMCGLAGDWSDESARHMTEAELAAMLGPGAQGPELDAALAFGLVQREGDGYLVPSPDELAVGYELRTAGVPLNAVLAELRAVREDAERIAQRMMAMSAEHVLAGYARDMAGGEVSPQVADIVSRLPKLALTVMRAELARAMRLHGPRMIEDAVRRAAGDPG